MKFFRKKIVTSIALVSTMTILASPMTPLANAVQNGYTVIQGRTTIGTYASRLDAIIEARRWADSKVMQGQGVVWAFGERDNLYRVIQGRTTIGTYENREDAVVEARRWADSRVVQDTDTVWSFGVENSLYRVVQGRTTIGMYENREEAIVEARRWADSMVVQGSDTVWTFEEDNRLYRVIQGRTTIGMYENREEAISEARRWADSTVTQGDDTVWTFGIDDRLYRVVQGNTTIGAYESLEVARVEVRKWAGANIVQNGQVVDVINFARPTSGRISSGFGPRWGRMHNGIDIAAPTGTPIIASDGGVVTEVTYEPSGYGRKVVIDHQNGYRTLYAHASRTHVRVGQVVSAGDTIASVGSTGRSTGPHLHFEIIENGRRVDPQRFL